MTELVELLERCGPKTVLQVTAKWIADKYYDERMRELASKIHLITLEMENLLKMENLEDADDDDTNPMGN